MVFFIPITCLLDIVRRNSVLVTHKRERVVSHCRWPKIIPWSHLSFYFEVSSHWSGLPYGWFSSVQLFALVTTAAKVYSDKGHEQEMSHRLDPLVSCLHFRICRLLFYRLSHAQCERMLSASAVKQSLSSSDLFCRHLLISQRLINLSFRKTLARKGVTLIAVSRHCSQVRKIHGVFQVLRNVESIFQ